MVAIQFVQNGAIGITLLHGIFQGRKRYGSFIQEKKKKMTQCCINTYDDNRSSVYHLRHNASQEEDKLNW